MKTKKAAEFKKGDKVQIKDEILKERGYEPSDEVGTIVEGPYNNPKIGPSTYTVNWRGGDMKLSDASELKAVPAPSSAFRTHVLHKDDFTSYAMKNDEPTPYQQTLTALEKMMDPTEAVEFWSSLGKEKTLANNCRECGSVGTTCCKTAQARLETANSLSGIVNRQSTTITRLQQELEEARQVNAGLRAKEAA